MLFNSFVFIAVFLPLVLLGFYSLRARVSLSAAMVFLSVASLFFYAYWKPAYLLLILSSILFNYLAGRRISIDAAQEKGGGRAKSILICAVIGNLLTLAVFKYLDFFSQTLNSVAHTNLPMLEIALPLAISFFTFQQIAFLVDCYRGKTREESFLRYTVFVSFFPQLIAGPIVHHRELMPQFKTLEKNRAMAPMIAMGLSLFAIGLFKKAVLADSNAIMADSVFAAANDPQMVMSIADSWGGALAYAMQIYFDFSGYSDMAIGLALLFGISLPVNFFAPYKATSVADFWRRWHITLSHFLRDHIYIPLGGNRKGRATAMLAVMVTMLLGGLWHGASWTFVIWGGLHGMFILMSHAGRRYFKKGFFAQAFLRPVYILGTFLIVTILWVFFRAESFQAALVMLRSMSGQEGSLAASILSDKKGWLMLGATLALVWLMPNSMKYMGISRDDAEFDKISRPDVISWLCGRCGLLGLTSWAPNILHLFIVAGLAFLGLLFMQSNLGAAFIYFDF